MSDAPSEMARRREGIVDRPHVSPWLLWAAEHHEALARQIEDARPDGRLHPWIEHRAYVISAVIGCVAFYEAVINEIFQDAHDRIEGELLAGDQLGLVTASIPLDVQERMHDYWIKTDRGRRKASTKYRRVLALAGCPPLDTKLFDDAALLIDVRNALVHYRPLDHFHAEEATTFEQNLRTRRIDPSRLVSNIDRAWWPERALGAGLARWALETVRAVADETCSALGVDPTYARYRRGSWFDAKPGKLELYMRRGHPRPTPPIDERVSLFGIPYVRPGRDETVLRYQNRSMHKLHIAEWHVAEFVRLEDGLTTLDFFNFEEEPFLPAQAHADGALLQLAGAFDAFACALAHHFEIPEKDPDKASFSTPWWSARLVDAAGDDLSGRLRAVLDDPTFDGLMFYRNLAAHRGVLGEEQHGATGEGAVGRDRVRFMLPGWLPPETPDYPGHNIRPILERYVSWGRGTLAGLNAIASSAWSSEEDDEGELVLREEMFEASPPPGEDHGGEEEAEAVTPEALAPRFGDWRVWFAWGGHDFATGLTVQPAWFARRGEAEAMSMVAVDESVDHLREWLQRVIREPTLVKATLWFYRPRETQTLAGLVLAPALRR